MPLRRERVMPSGFVQSQNRTEELSTVAFTNDLQPRQGQAGVQGTPSIPGSDRPLRALASLGSPSAFRGLDQALGGSYNLYQQRGLKTKVD